MALVVQGLQLWQEYKRQSNLKLFFGSGALCMAGADDSYESAAFPGLNDAGIRFEKLSVKDWPSAGRKRTLKRFGGAFTNSTQVFLPRSQPALFHARHHGKGKHAGARCFG
jgi:hypothetical protein